MKSSIQNKAKSIYSHFSKAPILEMVQYLVNENVDAQVLHQLKLIDQSVHKNPHVTSYGEKVYAAYERICKILVTYPSLEFVDYELKIREDKELNFAEEYSGNQAANLKVLLHVIEILNRSLTFGIESSEAIIIEMHDHLSDLKNRNQLITFLKEGCGEDYKSYIEHCLKKKLTI